MLGFPWSEWFGSSEMKWLHQKANHGFMWLSIKERRHCLLDFPEKCSDDKFVHANAQVGILYRDRERDNGLDNKTVPSRPSPIHPFTFSKILKSRNRNFNPRHIQMNLRTTWPWYWNSDIGASPIIHQHDHRKNLWFDPEPRVTIGFAWIFRENRFTSSSHVRVKLNGMDP